MKKSSMCLIKMKGFDAKESPCVFVPKFQKDIETANKIHGESLAKFFQYRHLEFHQKLFAIANDIVNDKFFETMLDIWDDIQKVFNIKLNLTAEIIQATRFQYNDDGYSLIYICKACFLEWERDPVSGNLKVSSIAFENMDNIIFTDFYNNCLNLWSYILKISKWELENEF